MPFTQIPAHKLYCVRLRGGKKPLWNCKYNYGDYPGLDSEIKFHVVGAGNTADNAIKDWQQQYRRFCSI